MRLTASPTHHEAMKALHRKYGRTKHRRAADWYELAMEEYIRSEKIPTEKPERRVTRQLAIDPKRTRQLLRGMVKIAKHKHVGFPVILDEALKRFLNKAENQ